MAIHFQTHEVNLILKHKRLLSKFIQQQVLSYLPEVRKITLQYIFCSDDYLLQINQNYLQHNTYTDIITFDLSDTATELQGEIYISIDRVAENATQYGVSLNTELHRVIFHGMLHLCGFKDKSTKDKTMMTQAENDCLEAYFNDFTA